MEYIPRQVTNSDVVDTTIDDTGVASSFIHLATDAPDGNDDEGTGFAVGCLWIDYSNGETYTCVGSTDEAAKWAAQDGSDDINIYPHQGESYGFSHGGSSEGGTPTGDKTIVERISLTSDGDSTDFGELTNHPGGTYTSTSTPTAKDYGWCHGSKAGTDTINRTNHTSPGACTDWGNATGTKDGDVGWSDGNTRGIIVGNTDPATNQIETFPYTSPGDASDSGSELTATIGNMASTENNTNGFAVAGVNGGVQTTIQYVAKASIADATDYGETSAPRAWAKGTNSLTHGFMLGGEPNGANIERHPFSSSSGSSDVAEMANQLSNQSSKGISSTTHGYIWGGNPGGDPTGYTDDIFKVAFDSPYGVTDVGEITSQAPGTDYAKGYGGGGTQY